MLKKFIGLIFILTALVLITGFDFNQASSGVNPNVPLPVDQAFALSVTPEANQKSVDVNFQIAPRYHLYKSRIHFTAGENSGYSLGKIDMPKGYAQHNEVLGHYETYQGNVWLNVPIMHRSNKLKTLALIVNYQGCKDLTFCYPAVTKLVKVNFKTGTQSISNYQQAPVSVHPQKPTNKFSKLFSGKNIFWVILSFLGFGILLSFTPCVLPMIPILSSIILGQEKVSILRSFLLSCTYVLSAAVAFAIAGYFTALAGHSVQAMLQNKWVMVVVALIFIALALSLFGLFDIKLPTKLEQKLHLVSGKQQGGTYVGTVIMGVLSSLIVSPCISAPLVGALIYISTTGNVVIGASALFALGLGMGIPLIIIGTLEGKLFIKTGSWMKIIKIAFGCLMLLMAIWMFSRVWLVTTDTHKPDGFNVATNLKQLKAFLNKAKQAKKPAIVDYYASWCVACKELEMNTFQNKTVREKLKPYMLIRADVTANNADTKAMESHFGVYAPPTVVILNKNGKRLGETVYGYVAPKVFIRHLP